MTYNELLKEARKYLNDKCVACTVCDGRACTNRIPGPGARGDNATRNYEYWQKIRLNMDTLVEDKPLDTTFDFFGYSFKYPFFAAPIGAINMHYSDKYDDMEYNSIMLKACAEMGIAAWTGDGTFENVMIESTEIIKEIDGIGVPVVKPWNMDTIKEKVKLINNSGSFAAAMDIDGAGLPFLRNTNPPSGGKSVEQMREIISLCNAPFIIKGIMTAKGAEKAVEAGASAIVVSNHGGRVLEHCPSTAEVLSEIVAAVDGRIKVLVDGGIRSGTDVFKALSMGADGVLICRPFVTAAFGGGTSGVKTYIKKIGDELEDAMRMCGAFSLKDIRPDMIRLNF